MALLGKLYSAFQLEKEVMIMGLFVEKKIGKVHTFAVTLSLTVEIVILCQNSGLMSIFLKSKFFVCIL